MKYKILNQIGFNKIILCFFVLSFFLPNLSQASVVGKTIKRPSDSSLNNGLLGYWTLDGNKINWATGAVIDSSGNNITGTTTNMSTTSSPTAGISGQGLYFDGVNDAVNLNKPSSMDFSGSSDFSISLWVKPTHISAYQCFLCKLGSLNPGGKGMYLGTYASEKRFMFMIRDGTNSVANVLSAVAFDKWYHLTATYNASTKTSYLYQNGVRSSPNTNLNLGDSSDASANLLIGDWVTNSSLYNGKGTIDEVRVYNRVLSDSEVSILYKQGDSKISSTNSGLPSTGLNSGLVGWWTFDGKDLRTNVTDRSGNNYNGYLNGFTSTTTRAIIGKMGQAFSFDGIDNHYIKIGSSDGSGSPDFSTSDFSISFWAKLPKAEAAINRGLIFKGSYGSGGWGVWRGGNTGYIILATKSIDGSSYGNRSITSYPINQWVHFIFTVDRDNSANNKAYVNGSVVTTTGTSVNTSTMSNAYQLYIGGWSYGNEANFPMDDVRIWNRALSATEILQLYNHGKANI